MNMPSKPSLAIISWRDLISLFAIIITGIVTYYVARSETALDIVILKEENKQQQYCIERNERETQKELAKFNSELEKINTKLDHIILGE